MSGRSRNAPRNGSAPSVCARRNGSWRGSWRRTAPTSTPASPRSPTTTGSWLRPCGCTGVSRSTTRAATADR
ncbi:mannan-binding protein [Streptomyces sp. enrichment culture]|uniref:mannan-binding protein n=1 Tax=Streptomyces sp. enrichment culture TaxID=1795815 RepID=UPI003F5446F0